jgi:hypothetical protein
MSRRLSFWAIGLSLAALFVWGGVSHYREQARLARQAQLQAERAEREAARAKAYIELRTPDEIAADAASKAEAEWRAAAAERRKVDARFAEAANAKMAEARRERAMRYALAGAKVLKQGMKDPESFVLRAATLQDDGAVCFQYRAKNSFGASLPGRFVIDPNGNPHSDENRDTSFAAAWARHCESIGEEVADAVKRSGAI